MRITRFILLSLAFSVTGCVNSVFYQPNRVVYRTSESFSTHVQDVYFESLDGTRLHGWFLPATGTPLGTVIHFHGNAQNLTAHSTYLDWLPAQNFNVFIFDYRGYGQSEGRPNRDGITQDSIAALRYVHTRRDVDPDRVVIFAQSIGCANALAALANERFAGVRAVALDSSFYSYRSIVRDKIKLFPVLSWFRWPLSYIVVSNGKSPSAYISKVAPVPLLMFHGTADIVVPYHHGQWLFAKANEPKLFSTVEGGQHTDALIRHASEYRPLLVKFFVDALDAPR